MEYEILSEEKKNGRTYLNVKHELCGNIFSIRKSDYNRGRRCTNPSCIMDRRKKTNLELHGVDNIFKDTEYIKNKVKEKYGVDNINKIKEFREKSKNTCIEKYGVDNPMKNEEIKNKIKKSSYKNNKHYMTQFGYDRILKWIHVKPLFTIDEYQGVKKNKYEFECNTCGYKFKAHIDKGIIPICRKCYPYTKSSKSELELKEFISQYTEYEPNKLFKENGKKKYEIDIYTKNKLGIELNGLYWHSETKRGMNYHKEKTDYFDKLNIKLFHIFENEWIEKKEIVKSMLLNKMNLTANKIFARKCEIRTVDSKTSSEFLNNNHIQGNINSSVKLGLYYNNELVALLTLGKPRYNKKYDWEILRYCNILNTFVVGGFSKLLKYFIRNYNPKNIITYADRRYSNGNVYLKNNFVLKNTSNPNYYYIKLGKNKLLSRIQYQKHKLKNVLKVFDSELTEWENMQLNGYDRIWDCGNYVFTWINFNYYSKTVREKAS